MLSNNRAVTVKYIIILMSISNIGPKIRQM